MKNITSFAIFKQFLIMYWTKNKINTRTFMEMLNFAVQWKIEIKIGLCDWHQLQIKSIKLFINLIHFWWYLNILKCIRLVFIARYIVYAWHSNLICMCVFLSVWNLYSKVYNSVIFHCAHQFMFKLWKMNPLGWLLIILGLSPIILCTLVWIFITEINFKL